MKTFNDIFTSKKFYEERYIPEKTLNFILTSKNLQLLKHLIVPKVQKYIVNITPSRRDEKEILIAFNNYPMCLEFNKYYAKKLLYTVQNNYELARKIDLSKYKKITGYVAKKHLEPYKFVALQAEELHERAMGNFINHATNPKLRDVFESLRSIILMRHKHLNSLEKQDLLQNPTTYNIANKTAFTNTKKRDEWSF